MLRLASLSLCIAVSAFAVAFAPAAKAAAQRTFVAANGLPANTAFNGSIEDLSDINYFILESGDSIATPHWLHGDVLQDPPRAQLCRTRCRW
jgi:hypothetical protein